MRPLGSHVQTWSGSAVGTVRAAPGGILKVLNTAIDRAEIVRWKAASPGGLVVYRHVFPDGVSRDVGSRVAALLASVQPIRDLVDVIETPWNEELQDAGTLAGYATMTKQAVATLEGQGFDTAIGNFSTSQPQLADWHLFAPALVPSKRRKFLSVHEYGAPRMQDGWGCLRYRLLKSPLLVLVTECGIDGGVIGQARKGWRSFTDAGGYAGQLDWYASEIAKDRVRATIFLNGGFSDWTDFDIAGQGAIEAIINKEQIGMPITFNVGTGVLALMAQHQDTPQSDEHYVVDTTGQTFKSETFGSKGLYQWSKQANKTVLIPFSVG